MAIEKNTSRNVFIEGRGNVSGMLAKSNEEVIHEEAELMDEETFTKQSGPSANDNGGCPIYATGESTPFHHGRGLGRGHGPETK